jgi:peptidoglycan/xylan/chitin deacetylase (PgdA/CDA1 family)
VFHGSTTDRRIALTVDDGTSAEVVAGYVEFAQRTGVHLTFSPNGIYNHAWEPHAALLRPLIAGGQVQIINHTFSHHDLLRQPHLLRWRVLLGSVALPTSGAVAVCRPA